VEKLGSFKAHLADSLIERKQILIFLAIWALWVSNATTGNFLTIVRILGTVLAVLWIIWIADTFFLGSLLTRFFAVYPRRIWSIPGIVGCSFLHSTKNANHILSNSQGFLTWGTLVLLSGIDNFVIVSILTGLATGLGLWLFERKYTRTVGASGVLFGYFGFLIARGYFNRDTVSALLSIASLFFYYFSLFGLFPSRPTISWKGHLFGFLGGVATAYYLTPIKALLPAGWLSTFGL
jgi:membrane associated rhomboid family serine protease